jgi:hypothetical protein
VLVGVQLKAIQLLLDRWDDPDLAGKLIPKPNSLVLPIVGSTDRTE